ncbi:hypothetical protein GGR58DRAFT_460600 [Xylaria digitata]|nr:hypothetical protein GGR58DRAFT_460600 [Xylaria digitata]
MSRIVVPAPVTGPHLAIQYPFSLCFLVGCRGLGSTTLCYWADSSHTTSRYPSRYPFKPSEPPFSLSITPDNHSLSGLTSLIVAC